jgi:hypothetical protein
LLALLANSGGVVAPRIGSLCNGWLASKTTRQRKEVSKFFVRRLPFPRELADGPCIVLAAVDAAVDVAVVVVAGAAAAAGA